MPSIRFDQYRDQLQHDGSEVRVHMSVMTGRKVAWGTIRTALTTTYAALLNLGLLNLEWTQDGQSGTIRPGMRVVVTQNDAGFDTGLVKGVMSIREYGAITTYALPVREWTDAYLRASVGDFVTIYEDIILGDKLVAGTDQFQPDHRPYIDENEVGFPIPHSGGWWAGYIDEQTGQALARFWGGENYTSDNNGMPTNTWSCPGATFTESTGANTQDAALVFTTPGMYNLLHTVHHPVTGKQKNALVPIRVHQRGVDEPYEVTLESLSGTFNEGWQARVRVYEDADLQSIPDGAPVVLWTEHRIAGDRFSIPTLHSSDRNHILMIGYLRRDTSSVTPRQNFVTFDVINPLQKLKEVPGFSKVMLYDQNPDRWAELSPLTVWRAMVQIAAVYTFLIESGHDLKRVKLKDYQYPAFYLQKQTPLDQMNELALSVDAVMTCGRMGQVICMRRPELLTSAEREDEPLWLTITEDDIYAGEDGSEGIEIVREHVRMLESLQCDGISAGYSGNQSFFSRYPGTPGRGTNVEKQEKLITSGQDDLNIRCGHYGAWHDKVFQGPDGLLEHAPQVRLALRGAYWTMLDIVGGRVLIDLPASSNPRGVRLDAHPFVVTGMTIEVADGAVLTRLDLQGETFSIAPGLTYVSPDPPTTYYIQPDAITPPDLTLPEPLESPFMGAWSPTNQRLPFRIKALSGLTAQFAYTSEIDYTYSNFVWYENSAGLGGAGKGIWMCADPWNYKREFALFTNGLYKIEDIQTGTWELVAPYTTIFGGSFADRRAHYMEMSINRRGFIMITCGMNMLAKSVDYGRTWSRTIIDIPGSNGEFKDGEFNTTGTLNGGRFSTMMYATNSPWNDGTFGRVYAVTRNNYYGSYILGDQTWGAQVWVSENWGGTFKRVFTGRFESGAKDFFGNEVGTATNGPGRLCLPYKKTGGIANKNGNTQELYWWSPGAYETFGFSFTNSLIMRSQGMGKEDTWDIHANATSEGFTGDLGGGRRFYLGTDFAPHGYHVFVHDPKYHAAILQTISPVWGEHGLGVAVSSDGGRTWTQREWLETRYGKWAQWANIHGWPLHTNFLLIFAFRDQDGARAGGLAVSSNFGQTFFGNAPTMFPSLGTMSGGYVARPVVCAEADLSPFIAPG